MIDVTIIGAGPAGCAAAVQCRRLGLDVLLMDTVGRAGGLVREARNIENYPGLEKPVTGNEFADRLSSHLSGFGIEVVRLHADDIKKVDNGFKTYSPDGEFRSGAVIVATGTVPKDFELPGDASKEILRSILDLPSPVPDRTIVIGGGEAALDYALNLSDSGSRVDIVVRASSLKAAARLKEDVASHENIRILYNTVPLSLVSSGNGLLIELLTEGNRERTDAGAVLAAIGRKQHMCRMPDELKHEPGALRTSIPGLYIVGDASLGSMGQTGIAVGHGLQAAGFVCNFLVKDG